MIRFLLIALCVGCAPSVEPTVQRIRDCRLQVHLQPSGFPGFVGITGDFNDDTQSPLVRGKDGTFRGAFNLSPGLHRYRLEIDGRPLLDAHNPLSVQVDDELWSLAVIEACEQPKFTLVERAYTPSGAPRYVIQLERTDAPLKQAQVTVDNQPWPSEISGDQISFSLAGATLGYHQVQITGHDQNNIQVKPLQAPAWVDAEPFRWRDAIIYQIIVDRFAADAPFTPEERLKSPGVRMGGHLKGVLRVLRSGYFDRLGVNVLWLSPLYANPDGLWTGTEGGPPRYSSYHGYWPIEPRALDHRVGSAEDLDALVNAAHARGVRVLVDVVLNHVHQEHPYVTTHPERFGDDSCICGTPSCSWGQYIESCWFTRYLPDIKWNDIDTLWTQVDDALWWVERFNLDGLRVDAVPMMPRWVTRLLSHQLHARREQLGTRHFLLGETFTGPNQQDLIRWYLGPGALDGQFDFPVMWALRAAFAWESQPLWTLADVWTESQAAWAGSTATMGQFVGNHDVSRFLSEAAGHSVGDPWHDPPQIPEQVQPYDRMRMAQTFVMTQPGAPVIYYGDEFGMPGARDPDNRRPMRFDGERTPNERALQRDVETLAKLRRCLPALRAGQTIWLRASDELLAYARVLDGGSPAIIVLPRAPENPTHSLALPAEPAWPTAMIDVLSGRQAPIKDGHLTLTVTPRVPTIWVPVDHPCAPSGA